MRTINDGIFIDPTRSGSVRSDHGRDVFRQNALKLLDVFKYAGACPIEVCSVLENNKDVGITEHGLGSHGLNVGSCEKGRDNGIGDLVLDDVWRLTFPGDVDDHLHIGDVRQRIERNVLERPDSGKKQHESPDENQEAVVRAPINNAGDHGYMSPCAWRLSCFVARTAPFLTAVMVIFHVPPLASVTCPS